VVVAEVGVEAMVATVLLQMLRSGVRSLIDNRMVSRMPIQDRDGPGKPCKAVFEKL
jgi:hypothetical protein